MMFRRRNIMNNIIAFILDFQGFTHKYDIMTFLLEKIKKGSSDISSDEYNDDNHSTPL